MTKVKDLLNRKEQQDLGSWRRKLEETRSPLTYIYLRWRISCLLHKVKEEYRKGLR